VCCSLEALASLRREQESTSTYSSRRGYGCLALVAMMLHAPGGVLEVEDLEPRTSNANSE